MTALKREIVDVVYTTKQLQVPYNSALNLYGNPDGDFASFRSQLQQTARERRDAEMDTLTAKYDKVARPLRRSDQKRKDPAARQRASARWPTSSASSCSPLARPCSAC